MKNIFDMQYIEKCEIDEEKIIKYCEEYKENGDYTKNVNYKIKIDNILYKGLNREITLILVYAELNNKEFNVLVKLDGTSYTYSIFGQDYIRKYNYSEDMKVEDIDIDEEYILENKYNKFTYIRSNN